MLRLVLSAMGARRAQAFAVLVLCALAVASSVAAPWYVLTATRTATDSDVRSGSPAQQVVSVSNATARTSDAKSTLDAFDRTVEHAYGAGLGTPVEGMTAFLNVNLATASVPIDIGYRDGVCAHVIVAGQCPTAPGQVMVTARVAQALGVKVGDMIVTKSVAGNLSLAVTGIYHRADPTGTYWSSILWSGTGTNDPTTGGSVSTLGPLASSKDAVLTTLDTMSQKPITSVTLSDDLQIRTSILAGGGGLTARLSAGSYQLQQANMSVFSLAGGLADSVAADRRLVRVGVAVSLAELLGLCWFALFLAARYTALDRRADVGLLKLRGSGRFTLLRLSMGQSVVPMLGGLVLGVVVASAAGSWFSQLAVRSRQGWELSGLAALAALLGAAIAIGFAEWRTGRAGVNDLLRRVPARRRGLKADVVDLVVVVLAAVAAYQGWVDSSSTGLVTVAPSLVALAIALIGARVLLVACGTLGAAAMRTGRVRMAVGTLQVSRRPGIDRVFVLLALSVALLATAALGWHSGADVRSDRATIDTGAPRVLKVQAANAVALLATVRAADPAGHEAMAVVEYPSGATDGGAQSTVDGGILAVDSSRFAAVTAWSDAYGATKPAHVVSALQQAAAPSVEFTGPSLSIDETATLGKTPSYFVVYGVNETTGMTFDAGFGPLVAGHSVLTSPVAGCDSGSCRVTSFELTGTPNSLGGFDSPFYNGAKGSQVVLHSVGTPSGVLLDGGALADVSRWRNVVGANAAGLAISYADDTMTMTVTGTRLLPGVATSGSVYVADGPVPLPAVQAGPSADDLTIASGRTELISGVATSVHIVDAVPLLPSVGGSGLIVDLASLQRVTPDSGSGESFQVWLAVDAPASLITKLQAGGLTIIGDDTIAADRDRLSDQGPAAALRFQILTGVIGLLLAAGAFAVAASGERRPRSAELIALRIQGLPRRAATAISYGGYAILVVLAVVAGVIAAILARVLAAVRAPVFVDDWSLVSVGHGLSVTPLLVVALIALIIYGITGLVAGRSIAKRAKGQGAA